MTIYRTPYDRGYDDAFLGIFDPPWPKGSFYFDEYEDGWMAGDLDAMEQVRLAEWGWDESFWHSENGYYESSNFDM